MTVKTIILNVRHVMQVMALTLLRSALDVLQDAQTALLTCSTAKNVIVSIIMQVENAKNVWVSVNHAHLQPLAMNAHLAFI